MQPTAAECPEHDHTAGCRRSGRWQSGDRLDRSFGPGHAAAVGCDQREGQPRHDRRRERRVVLPARRCASRAARRDLPGQLRGELTGYCAIAPCSVSALKAPVVSMSRHSGERRQMDYTPLLRRALRAMTSSAVESRSANVRSGILPPQSRFRGNDSKALAIQTRRRSSGARERGCAVELSS